MNQNVPKLIADLRSGKYKQGQDRLRRNDELCCLGVACEVYQEEVGDLEIETQLVYGKFLLYYYNKQQHSMPRKVMYYFGFSNEFC